MHHTFNVDFATAYGLAEAILFENIAFWCKKNKANQTNIRDGVAWTYNSVHAFEELFPYLTNKKIISALKCLEESGIIQTGCFNTNPYDRTKWYALTEKGQKIFESGIIENEKNGNVHLPKTANVVAKNGKCSCQNSEMNVTDINTDINTDTNAYIYAPSTPEKQVKNDFVKKIHDRWVSNNLPLSRVSRGNFMMFETVELKPVLSQLLPLAGQLDDILQAIDNAAAVRDLIESGGSWYNTPDRFAQFVAKIDRYLPGGFDIAYFKKKTAQGAQFVDDDKIEF